jgi:hypothetical protein
MSLERPDERGCVCVLLYLKIISYRENSEDEKLFFSSHTFTAKPNLRITLITIQ